ncbi:hypothetical protein K6L05_01180 [Salinicoccus roseus]|uniref:hypothetical protein n=1 Tax=Salinicoccus roseus TaxID=45670 RepID=UPI001CA7787E|nr:hypothetical protein [Salinicoccus roseus]MBY8908396.1 hypothetical protein [Salinicoccus roseus]
MLSNHDMYHARMIADTLTHEFGSRITIEVPGCIDITRKDLEHWECDLIITNFALEDFNAPHCIQVSQFFEQTDMLKVREALMALTEPSTEVE